jgi:hypothetical protein
MVVIFVFFFRQSIRQAWLVTTNPNLVLMLLKKTKLYNADDDDDADDDGTKTRKTVRNGPRKYLSVFTTQRLQVV